MKKVSIAILILVLLFSLSACGGRTPSQEETPAPAESTAVPSGTTEAPTETPAESVPETETAPTAEDWYGLLRGMVLHLHLEPDGSYTLSFGDDERSGSWEEKDGTVVLDGEEASAFLRVGDKLNWVSADYYLSREEPAPEIFYTPSALRTDASPEDYDGYWVSDWVENDGRIFPAEDLGDRTDVYVKTASPLVPNAPETESKAEAAAADGSGGEGDNPVWKAEREAYQDALLSGTVVTARAALGGPIFSDVIVDMVMMDGALCWVDVDAMVTLRLQEDGLLRLTLSNPAGETMTIYLHASYLSGME